MLIKGITQLNNVITEIERRRIRNVILHAQNAKRMTDESKDASYDKSFGTTLPDCDFIYERLTPVIRKLTGLKIVKVNSYARIYLDDGLLKPHKDREGLDLTLSIQIENTFGEPKIIFGKGYDGTKYSSALNDGDAVLLKGRELEHWRERINGEGHLICLFLHWAIVGVQAEEIENFITPELCKELIAKGEEMGFQGSEVVRDGQRMLDYSQRSSKAVCLPIPEIDEKLKCLVGNLELQGFQMLKYEEGNDFKPHFDNGKGLAKRLFTILIYLNDDYEGGETKFPLSNLTVKPEIGKLLIFQNLKAGENDKFSMHEGSKIVTGVKYVLVNWILID